MQYLPKLKVLIQDLNVQINTRVNTNTSRGRYINDEKATDSVNLGENASSLYITSFDATGIFLLIKDDLD